MKFERTKDGKARLTVTEPERRALDKAKLIASDLVRLGDGPLQAKAKAAHAAVADLCEQLRPEGVET